MKNKAHSICLFLAVSIFLLNQRIFADDNKEANSKEIKFCEIIEKTPLNIWVKIDENGAGKRSNLGLLYLKSQKKFLICGITVQGPKLGEMLFDPYTGKWEEVSPGGPFSKLFSENKSDPAYTINPTDETVYGYLGGPFEKKLLSFDLAKKTWIDLAPKTKLGAVPYDMFGIHWPALCWLPNGEIMLANGSAPFEGSGTWLYNPTVNDWKKLEFGSKLINDQRNEIQKLYSRSLDLAGASRNVHYRTGSVDIEKMRVELLAKILENIKSLGASASIDEYEKQQLLRAKAEMESALKLVKAFDTKLLGNIDVKILIELDQFSEALREARDELAVEPPARCNSPLMWHPLFKKVLMFGGDGHSRTYSDTWAFDVEKQRWMQMHPKISPAPRSSHSLLWLPKAQVPLMVGHGFVPNQNRGVKGLYETQPFEIWTYDFKTDSWSLIKRYEDKDVPSAGLWLNSSLNFAVSSDDLVIGMGQVGYHPQEQITTTWACRLDPKALDLEGAQKYGVAPKAVAFFGGANSYDLEPIEDVKTTEERLKNIQLNNWTRISGKGDHAYNGNWGTCIFDPDNDQILWWRGGHSGYCGNDIAQFSIKANTWNISYRPAHPLTFEQSGTGLPGNDFDGRPWQTMHSYRRYGYDPVAKRVVFNLRFTYTYDPVRRGWDEQRYPVSIMNMTTTPYGMMGSYHGEVFRFELGKGWVKLPQQGKFPEVCHYSTSFVYDSKRDRLLAIGKGIGGSTIKDGEVWSYDIKTGVIIELAAANASKIKMVGEDSRESVYLPDADMVLFGVGGPDFHYIYDCAKNEWRGVQIKPENIDKIHQGTGLTYDPHRKLVWAIVAGGDFADYNHVYALRFDLTTAAFIDLK